MPTRFDAILIGAGPAAVAALAAAPVGLRIAVVTGGVPAPTSRAHAKIKAVAYERREPPGLGEMAPFAEQGDGLFSTAAEGGLAGYWGQQFVSYGPVDPWPADIFADRAAYLRACAAVEGLFSLSPSEPTSTLVGGVYQARTPRLLVGTAEEPAADLLAMRTAFRRLASRLGAEILPRRAVRLIDEGTSMRALLDDGEEIVADRLLLGAGVVGGLRLIMASCPDITAGELEDHAPFMLYTAGLDRLVRVRREDGRRHFNALTLERLEAGHSRLFASAYRMGQSPLSLLLAAAGLPPLFRGWPAPPFADLIKPVQLWTDLTRARLRLQADGRAAVVAGPPSLQEDAAAFEFVGWLRANGVRVSLRGTEPGGGFHYYGGKVSTDGTTFTPVRAFLDQRFGGKLACVDASVLSDIGCRPHTLTAMAAGFALSGQAWRA